MQSFCINLKYLALFIVLSLAWIAPNTYASITSTAQGFITNADSSSLRAFTSLQYGPSPSGEILHPAPFSIADNARQIQWGQPFDPEIPNCGDGIAGVCVSAYVLRPIVALDIQLGVPFEILEITHYNRILSGSFITFFTFALQGSLNIDGTDIPIPLVQNINLTHDETLNPAADIATWNTMPLTYNFTHAEVDYELTLLGILPTFDPGCPGPCFVTIEDENNTAPISAVLNGVPIPEPSTYLLLSSMIGLVIIYQYYTKKKQNAKVKVSRKHDRQAKD